MGSSGRLVSVMIDVCKKKLGRRWRWGRRGRGGMRRLGEGKRRKEKDEYRRGGRGHNTG